MVVKTLADVLKEFLKDNHKASFYEAKVVRELVLADGHVSAEEKLLLENALHKDKFDDKAVILLSQLLLRADCQNLEEHKEETHKHKGSCC